MSAANLPGQYLPREGVEGTDLDYAQNFVDLARAVEACERSEDVLLLLSTCRNHWMTTNAAFLDLRGALGTGDLPDSVSSALYELRRGNSAKALDFLRKAGEYIAYAAKKLKVWEEREVLGEQLQESIDGLSGLARARVEAMLQQQETTAPAPGGNHHVKYLVLSRREEAICVEKVRVLKRAITDLGALRDVIREIATLRGDQQGSLLEPDLEHRRISDELATGLLDDLQGWELESEDGRRLSFGNEPRHTFDLNAEHHSEAWGLFLGHLIEVSLQRLVALQELLVENFKANVASAPMPEPYIVDLSVSPYSGTSERYRVKVLGTPEASPANETTVALLKWPIPSQLYNNTDLCRYKDQGAIEGAGAVIRAAIKQAAGEGAETLVLPELCIPGELADELEGLSRDLDIGLIAGREHRAREDGKVVNEALIHMPRLRERHEQQKQHPSVHEPSSEGFSSDHQIKVLRGTPLGTLMVVVCSDYIEHDVVTLAWHQQHIDTIVVCSRNDNPDVFARLAVADAIRAYCNVIVVNACPDDPTADVAASAEGTLIAVPHREHPLLELRESPLEVEWDQAEEPTLAFAELDMKAIYSRRHGRSDRGFLQPSRFASR